MDIVCHRGPKGRFVVKSEAGDLFEYQIRIRKGSPALRMLGPPVWREGPWPRDAAAIASAARRAAIQRARFDGFAI